MSLRRDLYKGRNSTPLAQGKSGSDENNHWVRDWYDPLAASKEDALLLNSNSTAAANSVLTNTTNTTASNTPEASDMAATPHDEKTPLTLTNEPAQLQGYEVKTWVISNNGSAAESYTDCDFASNPSATHIDLKQYRYPAVLRKGVNLTATSSNNRTAGANGDNDGDNGDNGDNGDDGDKAAGGDGISATDIKSAVGGTGVSGDTLFSSSAAIGQ